MAERDHTELSDARENVSSQDVNMELRCFNVSTSMLQKSGHDGSEQGVLEHTILAKTAGAVGPAAYDSGRSVAVQAQGRVSLLPA